MKASFKIPKQTLIELLNMTESIIYFKLLNDEVRFIEPGVSRTLVGRLEGVENYNLSTDISQQPTLSNDRIFAITRILLYYFSFRIGDKLEMQFGDKLKVIDTTNHSRSAEFNWFDISEKPLDKIHRHLDFVVRDNNIFTSFMVKVGNYYILEAEDNYSVSTKIPVDMIDEIKITMRKNGSIFEMHERKFSVSFTIDDHWDYNIIEGDVDEEYGDFITYYDPIIMKRYTKMMSSKRLIFVFTKEMGSGIFFAHNSEYILANSMLKFQNPIYFQD